MQVFSTFNLPLDDTHLILQVLLSNYEWSEEAVLPPKVLREALSNLFAKEGRFQINQMVHPPSIFHPRTLPFPYLPTFKDDAMEALDSILTCLHESLAKKREDGSSDYCEPACLVHQVSALYPAACFSSSHSLMRSHSHRSSASM